MLTLPVIVELYLSMEGSDKPTLQRDQYGKFIKVTVKTPEIISKSSFNSELPSLVDVRVTHPAVYLKVLLDKIFKNSEISFTVRIKPMALISVAIAAAILISGAGFGYYELLQRILRGF